MWDQGIRRRQGWKRGDSKKQTVQSFWNINFMKHEWITINSNTLTTLSTLYIKRCLRGIIRIKTGGFSFKNTFNKSFGSCQPWKCPSAQQHREKPLVFRDMDLGTARLHRSASGQCLLLQCHDSQHSCIDLCFQQPSKLDLRVDGFRKQDSGFSQDCGRTFMSQIRPTGWTSNYYIKYKAWFNKTWHTTHFHRNSKHVQFTLWLSKTGRTHQLTNTPIQILQP